MSDLAYNLGLEIRYAIASSGVDPIQHIPDVDAIIERRVTEIRAEAVEEYRVALLPFSSGGDWGKIKAWAIAGTVNTDDAEAAMKWLTSCQVAVNKALAGSGASSPSPSSRMTGDDGPRYSMKRMREEKAKALDYGWRHALYAAASAVSSVSEAWAKTDNADLQKALREAIGEISSLHSEQLPDDKIANAIIQAVAIERERCARIAAAEAEKRFENVGGYPAARVHDFMVVARSIEREINAGQPPMEQNNDSTRDHHKI